MKETRLEALRKDGYKFSDLNEEKSETGKKKIDKQSLLSSFFNERNDY